MTAVQHDTGLRPDLLGWLDEQGIRYEVIDGQLVVSPTGIIRHGRAIMLVTRALLAALPDGVELFPASLDVYYGGGSHVIPHVCVARTADLDAEDGLHAAPLLVVEVRSPSAWRVDQGRKREIYAELGVPSYWLVDPERRELTVLSLRDGAYVETARGSRLELTEPYDVVVCLTG